MLTFRSGESDFSDVSSFHDRRPDICVSVPTVRPISSSVGAHTSGEANKELPTQDVFFSLFFSGRLSTTGRISRGHGKSLVSSPRPFQEAGVLDQR